MTKQGTAPAAASIIVAAVLERRVPRQAGQVSNPRGLPSHAAHEGRRPRRSWPALESSVRAPWRRFKRLTQVGWPRAFPVVQFPNAPLILAFVAGEAAKHTRSWSHADASAVSYLAMTVWAYEELFHGVNWFRRLLGLAYTISTAAHLAVALRRGA